MRRFLFSSLAVLLSSASFAFAREPVGMAADKTFESGLLDQEKVMKSAAEVTQKKYPDADTVLVDDFVWVRYQPDGTDEVWDDTYSKVLTEKGREHAQSLPFNYNLFYDTVTVVRVEVIKPDGKVQPVDIAAQSQVMVDRSQMEMNIYDPNDRVVQVSVPDLEIGDVVHYLSHHRNLKTRMPNTWNDYQVFESTDPIKHYTFQVVAPTSRPLQRIELKDEVSGTVVATTNRNGEFITYRWDVSNVPQIFPEPNMPEYWSCVQRLLVSTVPDWQMISKWYWGISQSHLDATTPELIAKVKELTDGVKGERAKIRALFNFVSQQIRYMGITTEKEAPGYEPHDVSITFGQKYGVCRDKAALLVSMLRLADLKGFPVLINAGPKKDVGVPMPYFNHAIVAAQTSDGEYVLMDPTDENTSDLLPSYLSDKSYLVARPEGETLRTSPITPATNNLLRIATHATLDDHNLLKLDTTLQFDGINDNMYRGYFATIGPDERRKFFDTRIGQLLPGARLTDLKIEPTNLRDTSEPLKITLACEVPDYVVESDTHRLLALPWVGQAFGTVNHLLGQTGLEKRRFPLQTEIACGVEETVELELADSTAPIAMPHVPDIVRDDLEFRQNVSMASNHVSGKASFLLKAIEFPKVRYAELKQTLRDMEYARRQRIVLPQVVAGAGNPDAEIVKRDIHIVVKNEHEWTTTEDCTIKILSYAGKKRLSELKLDYNPIWEDVTITNATVTGKDGKDGKVHELAAQEVNVMDAEWVASAPRYPAAKTLVASLPGVEVGSTIHYTITKTRRDRPFFSTLATFRGFDPVREATMTVTTPRNFKTSGWNEGDGLFQSVETNGASVSSVWKITNQPALYREENMPPLWSFCPTVALSSGNWTNYAEEVIGPMVKAAKGNPEARKLAREIAKKAGKTPTEKATAIRDAVVRAVRLAGPQADDLPVSILTPADVTLREGYGNTRDRALLLYVMLDEAGFKPYFEYVSSGCPTVAELRDRWLSIPIATTFDTVLVSANIDGRIIYFNDTDQYARLGTTPHEGRPALNRGVGPNRNVEVWNDWENTTATSYQIHIATNGDASIAFEQTFEGMNYASFRKQMAEQTPEERSRFTQELIATISQAAQLRGDLVVNDKEYPGKLSCKLLVPRFAARDGRLIYFDLPGQNAIRLPGAGVERRSAYYDEQNSSATFSYLIEIPQCEVVLMPQTFASSAPDHLVNAAIGASEWKYVGSSLSATASFKFSPGLVPAHSYDELKEWNARVRHPANRSFMLKLAE